MKDEKSNILSRLVLNTNEKTNIYGNKLGRNIPKKDSHISEKISIIVTVYNEEENISILINQINTAMGGYDYELIIVNDGSYDDTEAKILEHERERIKLISFARNFGQTAALAAGIQHASGGYCVTIDGDLQNDPRDIPILIRYLVDEKYDMVVGWRKNRKDKVFFRKIPSFIANSFIRKITGVKVHDLGCALKVIKTSLAKSLPLYGEMHRYISLIAHWQGVKIGEVAVNHRPRKNGKSKYGLSRTFNVISDIMFLIFFEKYNSKPVHFFGRLAISCIFISGIIGAYLLFEKAKGNDIGTRPMLTLFVLFILIGTLFLVLGFISELINKIIHSTNKDSGYKIRNITTL